MKKIQIISKVGFYGSLAGIIACILFAWWMLQPKKHDLTIYCAHDSIHSEKILRAFETKTGIKLNIKFDTEATKSLGLVEQLLEESKSDVPQCDVFWNNEVLGTIQLQSQGVLEPYLSTHQAAIPEKYKDPKGYWTGFGARLRVYIVDPRRLQPDLAAITDHLAQADLSDVTIAKPLYGTTRTHYTALWKLLGPTEMKAWHQSFVDRKVIEVSGNAMSKNMVAKGVCALGFTDSDDYFVAKRERETVEMTPVRLPNDEVLCIPNTVALIRNARLPDQARQLIDFLLSPETEIALAKSDAHQIPLGPVNDEEIPEEVRALRPYVEQGMALNDLREEAQQCLAWLKELYIR